jgi:putative transposase
MDANQAAFPVRTMCRVLDVSPSGFYDWLGHVPSQRKLDDAVLLQRIRAIHAESDGTYGVPRIHAELAEQGQRVGRKRVARLMRQGGIAGVSRRRGFVVTTQRDARQRPAPELVQREFKADGPNRLWVADITYVPTWAGFIYLAIVLDACSRRVVGWCIGQTLHADLVLAALNMALQQRKASGVIHHSDQGSQYTSLEFGRRCQEMKVRPSMGSVGDAYENEPQAKFRHNAMAESFFATLECELLDRRSFKSKADARTARFTYTRVGTTRASGTRRWAGARRRSSSRCITIAPACHRRASNTAYPPSQLASQAPRRRWITLPRSSSELQVRLESQADKRPWKWGKTSASHYSFRWLTALFANLPRLD